MLCRAAALALVLLVSASAQAESAPRAFDPTLELRSPCLMTRQDASGKIVAKEVPRSRSDRPIDVLHYDLSFTEVDTVSSLAGYVTITLKTLETTDQVVLDFDSIGMDVLGVLVDGLAVTATHRGDSLVVPLGRTVTPSETLDVEVEFEGSPIRGEGVGFGYAKRYFRQPNYTVDFSRPLIATLSEPVGARTWWPCHDHPFDAATVDISVIAPSWMTVVAPGEPLGVVDAGGGKSRSSFSMPHEIPSYLVSLAAADYVIWTETTEVTELLDDGSEVPRTMPLRFYTPATLEADARNTWSNTAEVVALYEQLFGPYPYADIQYGMAMFSFGGAMEHPTVSSMGDVTVADEDSDFYPGPYGEAIVAHEAFHQWFGDAVRVSRWGDIWLNEGFARYGEVLWLERKYGAACGDKGDEDCGKVWLDRIRRDSYPGTLIDPSELFGITIYNKGAWVVHQLRQVMQGTGDAADDGDGLITALRNYVTDPALRYRAVTVDDLVSHCEAVYGAELDWFFDKWLYEAGRPQLESWWFVDGDEIVLRIDQPVDRVYRLPLPVRITSADGHVANTLVWVGEDGPSTQVRLPIDGDVSDLSIDPDENWLLDLKEIPVAGRGSAVSILETVPNPFNPLTRIRYVLRTAGRVRLDAYDARGRHVARLLDADRDVGVHDLVWQGEVKGGETAASGVYFLRVTSGSSEDVSRVTMLK